MKLLHMVTVTLTIIGALNWGLIGLFDFNLVTSLLGAWPMVENLVYIAVGVSAVYVFMTHASDCKVCMVASKKRK